MRCLCCALVFAALPAAIGVAATDAPIATATLNLVAGENFISLPLEPVDATVSGVFPAGSLPAGKDESDSTLLFTYSGTTTPEPNAAYYRLSDDGHWVDSAGGLADAEHLPADAGLNLRLPKGAAAVQILVAGRERPGPVIKQLSGAAGATNYHVLGWPFTCPARVGDLGLVDAGFEGGKNVAQSDEIRILDNSRGDGSSRTPKARIWLDSGTGAFVFTAPRAGPANDYLIEPGEAVIVIRKRAPDLTWTLQSPCPPEAP